MLNVVPFGSMASLSMAFAAPAAVSGTVSQATAATKTTGGSAEEKGLLDWILGGLQKQDQLLETDPILKKVDEKNGGSGSGTGTTRRKSPNSISLPGSKKSNGGGGGGGVFGGLFAKK